jgi:hypothetical protein
LADDLLDLIHVITDLPGADLLDQHPRRPDLSVVAAVVSITVCVATARFAIGRR